MSRFVLCLCAVLLLPSQAASQFFHFGRNKVQYTDFDWHVLRTEHFDIYYYKEMADLAGRGAALAEESYVVLTTKFNHTVAGRIPLVFYSSHLHFQQTNITPGFIPEGVGGFFEFMKGRVVIPYNGSMWDFRHVIRHELVHVFMHSKINRVLTDHRITPDHLPPLWFVEGLAEYWSIDWDVQADMVLRDAAVSGYVVPLKSIDAIFGTYLMYKEGQAVLDYIGSAYGAEKVLLMMENFWKHASFEEVFRATTGRDYGEFDREWTYALRKKYYPLLSATDLPGAVTAPLTGEGFSSKPVFHERDGKKEVYFIGNRSGYSGIYRVPYDTKGPKTPDPEIVVQGEKTEEFEAFHLFQSKIDISADGRLAFVTKSGENDALHIFDLVSDRTIAAYHFAGLVVIGSVSWSPDGRRLAFSAVDKTGSSDLYAWDTAAEKLERITNDTYDDRDPAWSPDGGTIAFSSDRAPAGKGGSYNLFLLDAKTGDIQYLTRGAESYAAPAWSPDGGALMFTSDLGGARNVWMLKMNRNEPDGPMKKLTSLTTAAFDPAWAGGEMVYAAFENFGFQLRKGGNAFGLYDSAADSRAPAPGVEDTLWHPGSIAGSDELSELRYEKEYSLDVAHSEIVTDPVFGTYGGAFLSLSDLLGNEQYYFLVYNTAQSSDEIVSSFNIAISRVSLQQRANYAYGIYRFSGRRYDLTDQDEFYYEKVFGGYLTLSYPLSKFRRIALLTSLSSSEKDASEGMLLTLPRESIDLSRRALFLSNSISYTHDNSLWGPSGPLDGSRYSFTLAYTTDIRTSNANYYSVIADYRRYFRIAQRSAYAVRFWLFYNDGKESRRFFMGGSWDLRGYPRWSIRGKKLWLISHELRFPFMDRLGLGFPFGTVSLSGFRGALFADAGGAWDDEYRETLGSVGLGFRLSLAGVFVLRYDLGKRIEKNFSEFQPGIFQQFFFGWDF
ncbi:MAG TPA: BamA/TamA family outer membrane protein [Bacteroidota bacterium]|nr:BamA/TamA family outer membrane protein [Bacteroidota bacterium]